MTQTQLSITDDSLALLGLIETGGGDNFTMYGVLGETQHVFYVFDDLRWEYRDFSVCTDDEGEPIRRGRGLASLQRWLVSIRD